MGRWAVRCDLRKIMFKYPGSVPGPVALVGSFNQWNRFTHPLRRIDGEWRIEVFLPPGNYPYAFVIDGQAARDHSGQALDGPPGERYSVVTVAGEMLPVWSRKSPGTTSRFSAAEERRSRPR
jgi:1,4-alpha-glucan branching enzyme